MPAWIGNQFSLVPKGNGELFTPGVSLLHVCCSCNSWFGIQELEAIKAKLREIEKEDERLKELQLEAENHLFMNSEAGMGCPSPGTPLVHRVTVEVKVFASAFLGTWDWTYKVGEGGPRPGVVLMYILSALTSYLCGPRCSKLI